MARKGQAAMEFLMTYGWAILAVLVMIGALAYFGVINPKTFMPDKCMAAAGISCVDYRLSGDTNLAVEATFENSMGESITIQEISAKNNAGSDADCFSDGASQTKVVPPGERFKTVACSISSGSNGAGQNAKADLIIMYKKTQGGEYMHNVSVQIQAKVAG